MSASLNLSGLRELAKSLDVLPDGLEDKVAVVVREAAFDTANELRSALPIGPGRWVTRNGQRVWMPGGTLRRRVRVQKRDTTRYTVISGAPHAWINEEGTAQRQTRDGANRGISPASKTVARVASDRRRRMNGELEQVLVQVLGSVQ